MWRSTMLLLCFLAALSGTPLRQAEAASDFARSIGEFGQGDVIETIDGGVGDDQEASILKAGCDTHSLTAALWTGLTDVDFALPVPPTSLLAVSARTGADPCRSRSARSLRRIAWLQCFLF